MMLTYPTPVHTFTAGDVETQAVENWKLTEQMTVETSTQTEHALETQTSHLKAAQLFERAISTGTLNVIQPGIEDIFLADLYRRAGDFSTADKILNRSRNQELEASLVKVLEYEQELIIAQDIGYYQIAEALET